MIKLNNEGKVNLAKKDDMESKWKKVATQAVTNEVYKQRLIKDPLKVMKESGIEPPKEIKINISSADKAITLILPEDASEELKTEVAWWNWRLKAISEFGRETETEVQEVMPETEEGI